MTYCDTVKPGSTMAMVAKKDGQGNPMLDADGNAVLEQVQLRCPRSGVDCSGTHKSYMGDVWHSLMIRAPNCSVAPGAAECDPLEHTAEKKYSRVMAY
jgi:hypothetical protein